MNVERIVLAATNVDAMVEFHNPVFDAGLAPMCRSPLHAGSLAGTEPWICPNDIAEVDAQQNRHQLRIAVDDVSALIDRALASGGTVINDAP